MTVTALQYIKCTARDDRWRVAKIAAERGVPFVCIREIHQDNLVETIGRVELSYKREVAAWFRESIERPDDAPLAYAVTTDDREMVRETERAERIEAARCALAAGVESEAPGRHRKSIVSTPADRARPTAEPPQPAEERP